MDILLWALFAASSIFILAIGFYLKQISKWIWIPALVIAGLASIAVGLLPIAEGIAIQNGTVVSENWTYAPQICTANTTYYNGTDSFTDNTTSTCWFANASTMQTDNTYETVDTLYTQSFALLFFFLGFATIWFAIIGATRDGWF